LKNMLLDEIPFSYMGKDGTTSKVCNIQRVTC
jgi:hypothetical protein